MIYLALAFAFIIKMVNSLFAGGGMRGIPTIEFFRN